MRKLLLAAAIAALLPTLALAQPVRPDDKPRAFFSGAELLDACTTTTNAPMSFCAGVLGAVSDALTDGLTGRSLSARMRAGEPVACIPASVSVADVRDVVVARLRVEPKRSLLPAASLAAEAIAGAWPCRRS